MAERDVLSVKNTREVLVSAQPRFKDEVLHENARQGYIIDLRDARAIFKPVAKQWKHMLTHKHTWGLVTSLVASVVIEIDWLADRDGEVVYYYPLGVGPHGQRLH